MKAIKRWLQFMGRRGEKTSIKLILLERMKREAAESRCIVGSVCLADASPALMSPPRSGGRSHRGCSTAAAPSGAPRRPLSLAAASCLLTARRGETNAVCSHAGALLHLMMSRTEQRLRPCLSVAALRHTQVITAVPNVFVKLLW